MNDNVVPVQARLEEAELLTHATSGKDFLVGIIYDDQRGRFPDGVYVRTSYLVEKIGEDVYRTLNTVYQVKMKETLTEA